MATVTGLTADRMLAIEAAAVVDVRREGDNIIFITKGGQEIDIGDFKGGKGDQGDLGLNRIDVSYAESEYGVTPPEEGYTEIIPVVQSGWYLWTKFEFIASDNSVTVSYLTSRMGVDGNISSVNGKTDANVVLEASDVGAVSNTDPDYRIWPGTVWDFAGETIPPTWVECDGAYYEIDDQPALYAAIGKLHGSTTETNFRVPNINGRTTFGVDPTDPSLNQVGKRFGSKTFTLSADQIPELSAENSGGHTHGVTVDSAGAHSHTITVNSGGAHSHGIGGLGRIMTTDRVGQFTQKDGSVDPKTTAVTPAYGAHTSVASETATASGGAHAHTATANNTGAHSHTASSSTAGDHGHVVNPGAAVPVTALPPGVVMRKIIKL